MFWAEIKGWKKYQGFGLHVTWLESYYQKPGEWRRILGNRQVESAKSWLRTTGLADGCEGKTPLAGKFMAHGFNDPGSWELIWVNVVFNWPTAAWYVKEMGKGRWTTGELKERLQYSAGWLAPRTVSNAVQELVGFLQHTPVGSVLGQGEVKDTRPRQVERKGYPSPSEEAVIYALHRLLAAEGRSSLRYTENLLWPWVVFGCTRQEILELLGAKEVRESFQITGESLMWRTFAEEG